MKLGELAARLGCTLEGDAQIEIHGAEGLEDAKPGEVTFLSNPKYGRELSTTRASAVLVGGKVALKRDPKIPALAALRSGKPYLGFAPTLEFFPPPQQYAPVIHPTPLCAETPKTCRRLHS